MPGLYDQGMFVDELCNQQNYNVQELPVAEDKEIYQGSYFITNEEENYVIQKGMFVNEIKEAIIKEISCKQ
jgi:hypothetical protein